LTVAVVVYHRRTSINPSRSRRPAVATATSYIGPDRRWVAALARGVFPAQSALITYMLTHMLEARDAGRRTAGTGAATDPDGALRRSNI